MKELGFLLFCILSFLVVFVIRRYGIQQGYEVGYNDAKDGRARRNPQIWKINPLE